MQNVTAAAEVVAAAAADDATVAWVQKLITAVQTSAGLTGWSIQTLAADPNVQVLDALFFAASHWSRRSRLTVCIYALWLRTTDMATTFMNAEPELVPRSLKHCMNKKG